MPDWVEHLLEFVAGAMIAGLVWGLRLEALVRQNSKDIDRIDDAHAQLVEKHESLDEKIMEKFETVMDTLARIEERLKFTQK